MPVVLVAGIFVTVTLVYIHFTKHNDEWIEKKIAGPEPTLFFGNTEDAVLRRTHIGEVTKKIYDAYPKEKVLGMFVMRNPEWLVRDLDVVKDMLIDSCDMFVGRDDKFEKSDLGAYLLEGTFGMQNVFHPLFALENLHHAMPLINERCDKFVKHVEWITQIKEEHDVYGLVQTYTQTAVAAYAFGVKLDTFNEEDEMSIDQNAFNFNFGRELEILYPGILKKLGSFLDKGSPLCNWLKYVSELEIVKSRKFLDTVLKLKNVHYLDKKDDAYHSLFSLDITDENTAAHAHSFYTAACETTASTLVFSLYQLALNPDIQDKVVTEIKAMLEEQNNEEISLQSVLDLSYMGKVISETLRMYPTIPDLRKKSINTYKIPGTNLKIEKDELIRISVLGIHHDEKIYPNPEVFDPQRFSPENMKNRHVCSYYPFVIGGGPFIGTNLTQVLSRVCLVKLLHQYRVEPSEDTPKYIQIDPTRHVLCPKGTLPIKFVKRIAS